MYPPLPHILDWPAPCSSLQGLFWTPSSVPSIQYGRKCLTPNSGPGFRSVERPARRRKWAAQLCPIYRTSPSNRKRGKHSSPAKRRPPDPSSTTQSLSVRFGTWNCSTNRSRQPFQAARSSSRNTNSVASIEHTPHFVL